jgi:hypothetical protein
MRSGTLKERNSFAGAPDKKPIPGIGYMAFETAEPSSL